MNCCTGLGIEAEQILGTLQKELVLLTGMVQFALYW